MLELADYCFRLLKTTYHRKHGADRVCFTHHPSSILCSSRYNLESAESLRYLSLYDNRCLRYFKGHKDRFVCLFVSSAFLVVTKDSEGKMLRGIPFIISGLFHYACHLSTIASCQDHLIIVSEYGIFA